MGLFDPNWRALTKSTPETAVRLLSGNAATVKRGVDQATALRYVDALKAIGVACHVEAETLDLDPETLPPTSDRPQKASNERFCVEYAAPISAKLKFAQNAVSGNFHRRTPPSRLSRPLRGGAKVESSCRIAQLGDSGGRADLQGQGGSGPVMARIRSGWLFHVPVAWLHLASNLHLQCGKWRPDEVAVAQTQPPGSMRPAIVQRVEVLSSALLLHRARHDNCFGNF